MSFNGDLTDSQSNVSFLTAFRHQMTTCYRPERSKILDEDLVVLNDSGDTWLIVYRM